MQMFTDEILEKMNEILDTETALSEDDDSYNDYRVAWEKLSEWLKNLDNQTK